MLVKKTRPGCFGLLFVWLGSALAIWLTAYFLPGVQITDYPTALVVAVVLGLLNALVRPILVFFTLPITFLTLGLFLLLINAAMVLAAAHFVDGFSVAGWMDAGIAAIVLTVVSWFISKVVQKDEPSDDP